MIRSVLIVDDNPVVRKALRNLFMSESDFEVCGEAENGRQGIEKAYNLRPDLVVMDFSMPVMNGLDAARCIHLAMPAVRIIMFSEYAEAFDQREAHSAGISGLISKSHLPSALIAEARNLLMENTA